MTEATPETEGTEALETCRAGARRCACIRKAVNIATQMPWAARTPAAKPAHTTHTNANTLILYILCFSAGLRRAGKSAPTQPYSAKRATNYQDEFDACDNKAVD